MQAQCVLQHNTTNPSIQPPSSLEAQDGRGEKREEEKDDLLDMIVPQMSSIISEIRDQLDEFRETRPPGFNLKHNLSSMNNVYYICSLSSRLIYVLLSI